MSEPPWTIRSVELGPLHSGSGSTIESAEAGARCPWGLARESLEAASRGLIEADAAALAGMLAPAVLIRARDTPPSILPRPRAVAELLAWRSRWRDCEVILREVLVAGSRCAATGYVLGIEREGSPSCTELHVTLDFCT